MGINRKTEGRNVAPGPFDRSGLDRNTTMIYEAIHNTIARFVRLKPISLVLLLTEKCNARCIMCNIWKKGISSGAEMSADDYRRTLAAPFFSRISSVMLSGGEALLRPDIVSIVEVLHATLPRLKKVSIATNGLATQLIKLRVEQIAQRVQLFNESRFRKSELVIQVSYDGVSTIHDRIRGPNAHNRVTDTIQQLIKLRENYSFLRLSAGCVIQPLNLDEIVPVYEYLSSQKIFSIFTVVCQGEYYYANEASELIRFSETQLYQVQDTLVRLIRKEPHVGKKFLYNEFRKMLSGRVNTRGCPAMRDVMTIEPNGKVVPCLNGGERAMGSVLEESPHDIWFSKRSRDIIASIEGQNCPTCMFACGASYLEILRYVLFESWKKASAKKAA